MIQWMDFVFDQNVGALLVCDSDNSTRAQDEQMGGIQETRHVQRPARMVGPDSLDLSAQSDMDVGGSVRITELQAGGRDER